MKPPIVIAAFGLSPATLATCDYLATRIHEDFPASEIIWSYAARGRTGTKPPENPVYPSPAEVLRQLAARGVNKVVLQSLHLLPGTEFHDFRRTLNRSAVTCGMGMPLLATPEDFHAIGEILRPAITARPGKAILLIGHGTAHPTWTAYYGLEKILRRSFGERVFVGVIEKFPDSATLPAEIRAAGFTEVCIIPCLLVAGMHFRRDIAGENPGSWTTRLRDCDLEVETIDHGLGLFPGMDKLISRHIAQALIHLDAA